MAILTVQHVTKRYGKGEAVFTALDDVSLDIRAGESIAIIGKSGSGKSTLLHMLALLDKPTAGTISVEDKQASHLPAKQLGKVRNKRYGFVFQQFFLNERDSALDNVTLPLKIAGVKPGERMRRGMEALEAVDLEQKTSSQAGTLSGGQKQRVCIARALINNPSVIFADEPTGNLDSHNSKVVENLLFTLNKKHQITLIIVTHDTDLAARCDRQLHIKDGTLINRSEV